MFFCMRWVYKRKYYEVMMETSLNSTFFELTYESVRFIEYGGNECKWDIIFWIVKSLFYHSQTSVFLIGHEGDTDELTIFCATDSWSAKWGRSFPSPGHVWVCPSLKANSLDGYGCFEVLIIKNPTDAYLQFLIMFIFVSLQKNCVIFMKLWGLFYFNISYEVEIFGVPYLTHIAMRDPDHLYPYFAWHQSVYP